MSGPSPLLADYLRTRRARVDRALDRLLRAVRAEPPVIREAMRYSVFAGGKRLRPLLCLMGAEAAGGDASTVMPAACAIEMIHTYSLVHDDLPAMDDDDFRRGRPTSHKKFGEGIAVLAGDALLTHGLQGIARNARVKGVGPAKTLAALDLVAEAIGTVGMIGGQVMDLQQSGGGKRPRSRRKVFFRRKLEAVHRAKTAALIRASLKAGATLVGAPPAAVRALDRYGEAIGLAFQIADDVLDVVGDKKLLGKRGSDRDNAKLTFPALYGLEASRRRARAEAEKAKRIAAGFGRRARLFQDLADYIVDRQH